MASFEKYQCTVVSNEMITPTVFILSFDLDHEIQFLPGQFLSVIIPGAAGNGRDLRRAYSIASSPEQRPVQLCIKKVDGGPGTTFLHALRPGDQFGMTAPYGDFVYKPKPDRDFCFISTGTGISPYHSIVRSALYREQPPRHAKSIFGVRHDDEVLYGEVFANISGLDWHPCVSRPEKQTTAFKGRVSDFLRNAKDLKWGETEFYLCGNGDMIKEVKTFLMDDQKVDRSSIHLEKYY